MLSVTYRLTYHQTHTEEEEHPNAGQQYNVIVATLAVTSCKDAPTQQDAKLLANKYSLPAYDDCIIEIV